MLAEDPKGRERPDYYSSAQRNQPQHTESSSRHGFAHHSLSLATTSTNASRYTLSTPFLRPCRPPSRESTLPPTVARFFVWLFPTKLKGFCRYRRRGGCHNETSSPLTLYGRLAEEPLLNKLLTLGRCV